MSNITGGTAFPNLNAEFVGIDSYGQDRFEIQPSGGMTLRDYFAAKAMQAEMMFPDNHSEEFNWAAGVASTAYRAADAMLAERDKPESK